VFVGLLDCPLTAQYVVPAPQPGCLLPPGTLLKELFVGTTPSVGPVYHPAVGTIVNAYLTPDTKEWVRTALAGGCPADAGAQPIAIHIKRITLAESGSDTLVRSGAFVDLEVLEWTKDEWRIRFTVEGESLRKTDPQDGTRHARHVNEALQSAMSKYAAASAEGQLTDAPFAIGAVEGHEAFPIQKMHGLPPGVFWTAEDFRQGRLTPLADSLLLIGRDGSFKLKGALRREEDKIFAISDGSHYHVRWEGHFRELMWDGVHFTASVSRMEYSTVAALAFGLMGAALSSRRVDISLQMDLAAGQLRDVSPYTAGGTVKHVFLFDPGGGVEDRVVVQVWDDRIVLEPGAYCELSFLAFSGTELIRVSGPSGTLEMAVDADHNESGLHLIQLDEDGRPVSTALDPVERTAILEKLHPSMLRNVTGQ
jgi:hypothetical protein